MELLPVKRALISVTDKSGLEELCQALDRGKVEIISTGGTKKKIADSGFSVTSVSDVTGFPEILNGRVKTLHPHIHAGVLADKDNPEHLATLQEIKITPFDLICVNLYDFANALKKNLPVKELVEEIDIGGPTLLRAGAKNFHSIAVLPSPSVYPDFITELEKNNFQVSLGFRKKMAALTFRLVSEYDRMIAQALAN